MANENKAGKNDTVGLFLQAMVDREPGKRKVKPSKAALVDLAELDLGESSDDSDFNVDEAKLHDDDDLSINSDPDAPDDDDDDDDTDDGEDDEHGDEEDDMEATHIGSYNTGNKTLNVTQLLEQAKYKQALEAERGLDRPKILVCAVCLGDHSDDLNEIVTCDGCSVSVHEGCYGISDTVSVSSTVSSCSTEPWFCDACKAGVVDPPCELCPNLGYTIFKETEMGRWVHLVCALYIPGVAFSEVDKLSFPTLFEMPYSKWGAKTCILCEDERYSRTGVCIGCDAGMCRAYFHVTCAQREGLLSEVNHGEADQADPYYAHCKLHTDRELIRRRKRNWLALQLHMKQGEADKSGSSQETQDRIQRKLGRYRDKYLFNKNNRPTPWYPTQKMPRALSTSASLFRSLLHKTELMGLSTETQPLHVGNVGDIRKKWHIPPAFNVEFISYYLDRTTRLAEMKDRLDQLLSENSQLVQEETQLRIKCSDMESDCEILKSDNDILLNKALELHDLLKGLAGRPLPLPPVVAALHNPPSPPLPTRPLPKGSLRGPIITKAAAKMMMADQTHLGHGGECWPPLPTDLLGSVVGGGGDLLGSVVGGGGGGLSSSSSSLHHRCCRVCQRTQEQHLLIECDTCSHHYHLSCLDPPLTRMPKKTKQMGWQCSDCCKSSDSDKAPEVDTAAPRRLRRNIKEPAKFSPSIVSESKVNESLLDNKSQTCGSVTSNTLVNTLSPSPGGDNTPTHHLYHPGVASPTTTTTTTTATTTTTTATTTTTTDAASKRKRNTTDVKKASSSKKRRKSQGEGESCTPSDTNTNNNTNTNTISTDKIVEGITPLSSSSSETLDTHTHTGRGRKAGDVPISTCTIVSSSSSSLTTTTTTTMSTTTGTPSTLSAQITHTHTHTQPQQLSSPTRTRRQQQQQQQQQQSDPDPTSSQQQQQQQQQQQHTSYATTDVNEVSSHRRSAASTIHLDTSVESLPSAASLHSPTSESFHSAEDDPTSPRKEKRHRDGSKKKKKDKDKESEGGRKRKKHHHRDKHNLGEMASEIVTPFRIKIKPLPPRPADDNNSTTTTPSNHQTTTTTTTHNKYQTVTPPAGYPPLPPGYTLTQPMAPPSTTPTPTTTTTTTLQHSTHTPSTNHTSTVRSHSSGSGSVGRRRSDPSDPQQFSKCDVCGETGGVTNTVACDECNKAYHFNCLEPPLKKSPKRRGYSWFCEDCDNAT
ncbi:hypothetical protein Pmani_008764 [Petrolisthes manimaculis]|uniref:PHD finger protein 14 n=1 Tax=Petrolisthes manimaculis TaxID=1843537 RepID=A0AAE1UHF3_9EUCA|nr:hypothetical protein Pmani_008764 [Petrolisthes manimaculis]KAK4320347.1 hypothetical protein Pmani_008764 [Petrolisthes manimaculis]